MAADLIRQQALDLVRGLDATRREVARQVMADGVRRGLKQVTIQRRIAQVIGLNPAQAAAVDRFRYAQLAAGVPPQRAERQTAAYAKRILRVRMTLIAEHEVNRATLRAQRAVWRDAQAMGDYGVGAVRVTRNRGSDACRACKTQDGTERPLTSDLSDGPPFHPRCRCTEEVAGPMQKNDGKGWLGGSMVGMIGKAITPGGRVGDASSLNRSPRKNWVENAGGLPKYIRMVAHAMMRKGHPRDKAIQMAVGIVRNWAQGQENVSPKVRAAAVKAIAEWEAKKKRAKVSKAAGTTWNLADYALIVEQLEQDRVI